MSRTGKIITGIAIGVVLLALCGWYVWPGSSLANAFGTVQKVQAETTVQPATHKQPTKAVVKPPVVIPPDDGETSVSQQKAEQRVAEAKHEAYVQALPSMKGKQIAAFSTSLAGHSASGRVMNIELAAKKISGTILLPGDEFSFNNTTGDSNQPSAGWQLATVIVGKDFQQGYGGGICQVSSTMYNAVLEAGLGVTERYSHSLPVGYVAPGHDATVSYPDLDFKFVNTLHVPVKVIVKVADGNVYCQLYELPAEA